MISTIEIYRAIRGRLEETFPNITVQQKDIKNIEHPSFYIQYIGKNFEQQAVEYYEDRISFNIIYFAEKEELLELLEIEETFTRAFNKPLFIADDTNIVEVQKDALQSNLNEEDYFLNLTVDFVLSQRMSEDETGADIEHIDMTVENENKAELTQYSDDPSGDNDENDDIMSDIGITTI